MTWRYLVKTILCQCGKTIRVLAGVGGYRYRFPQTVYLCPCGMAYLPQEMGCMAVGLKEYGEPKVLSANEYATYKAEELKVAAAVADHIGVPTDQAFKEILAEVVTTSRQA